MRYFFIISLLFSTLTVSSDPNKCSLIENDKERLSCYDNIFIKTQNLSIDEENQITPLILSIEDKEEQLIIKEKELLEKEVALQKKEKELESDQERRWFGFTKRIKDENEPQEEIKIISKIETVATKLNSQLLIILENEQHWISVEKYRRHKLKDGYDVEITKGFLSGFALRVPETKIKIRVRRIK
jgi:hypothetical protein